MIRKLARQIVPPIFVSASRRIVRRVLPPERSAEQAELERLRQLPEGQPATTNVFGRPFEILDGRSFAHLFEVYFKQQLYAFKAPTDCPYIIDCGANTGVTVTWWKHKYPNARVLAFEADPEIFRILERNCGHSKNVQLVNAAVWDKEGEVAFSAKGGEGSHIAELSSTNSATVLMVRCVRLHPYLAEKCDFLKMDIEGAEQEELLDCADRLQNVEKIVVEHHSFIDRPQNIGAFIGILETAGFRVHVYTEMPANAPFLERPVINGKDLRLVIFAFRASC
jgi:FkbM family methyltransferase